MNGRQRLTAGLLGLFFLPATAPALMVHNEEVTPDVIMGSGIPNGYFTVDRSGSIELGLRARLRPGVGTASPSVAGTWTFLAGEDPSSPGWATWNLDWSINVDHDGSAPTGTDLDDYTYLIGGEEIGAGSSSFDPVILPADPANALALACAGNSFGTNATGNGGGTEVDCSPGNLANAISDYNALLDASSVVQNSWNPALVNLFTPGAFDPDKPALYRFWLAAFDGNGQQLAYTEIRVRTVPEPGVLLLSGVGLLAAAAGLRRRREESGGG